jgi:hypothetical protein
MVRPGTAISACIALANRFGAASRRADGRARRLARFEQPMGHCGFFERKHPARLARDLVGQHQAGEFPGHFEQVRV